MVLLNLFSLQKQVLNLTMLNQSGTMPSPYAHQLPSSTSSNFSSTALPSTLFSNNNNQNVDDGNADAVSSQFAAPPQPFVITSSTSLPALELLLGTFTYLLIIGITILGNTLVILAVFSYRPLKKVQNYFIVSLAASDMLVALAVMPLHVVKFLANGHWLLGVAVCQMFTTADILLCTSSILNLCAIALDRYWAIRDPIGYAQKRSLKRVCAMIILVWVASAVISMPPMIGWNDWTSQSLIDHCELTSEKAFVVFSACGSFFLPLAVMTVVYVKIFLTARARIRKNRGRSALFRMANDMQHEKRCSRTHRAPVAATSVIALASATGAQIFRRHKQRKSVVSLKEGTTSCSGGISSSNENTAAATMAMLKGVTKEDTKANNNKQKHSEEIIDQNRPSADSGIVAGPAATNRSVLNVSPPITQSSNAADFPMASPLGKRHFLLIDQQHQQEQQLQDQHQHPLSNNLAGSTSLLVLHHNSNGSIANNGGVNCCHQQEQQQQQQPKLMNGRASFESSMQQQQKQQQQQLYQPETVELKTHLKEREKISVAKEKRAAKTIAVIIFVFTFCWLPFFCAYVIMPFCANCYLHPKVHQAFVWLGYINSSLNPFLYGILNLEFRQAFRKILCPKRVQNAQQRRMSAQVESMRKRAAAVVTTTTKH